MIPSYRRHGFLICLIGVILLAVFLPEPGMDGGFLHPEWTTKFGVWMIFLIQGISLPGRELASGYKPLRLQAFVIGWNFLLFPTFTLLFLWGLARFVTTEVALGFGLLSILPTTIASAVAFTSMAGGRSANALCATVLSNVLAVLVVPLWVALYLKTGESIDLPLTPLLTKLSWLIVCPMLFGQFLRLCFKRLADLSSLWMRRISSAIILFIIYAAFADSVASGLFTAISLSSLVWLLALVAGLMLCVSVGVWKSSSWLRLDSRERIAAFFCASQKSLATGIPLATAILAALPESVEVNVGALLLPLIVYHPLQLVLASVVSSRSNITISEDG
jgi:sodium/bile acid cotransporter 7